MRKLIILVLIVLISGFVFADCGINFFDANSIKVEENTQIGIACVQDETIKISIFDSENNLIISKTETCTPEIKTLAEPFNGTIGLARVVVEDGCLKEKYFSVSENKKETNIPDNNFLSLIVILLVVSFVIFRKKLI